MIIDFVANFSVKRDFQIEEGSKSIREEELKPN